MRDALIVSLLAFLLASCGFMGGGSSETPDQPASEDRLPDDPTSQEVFDNGRAVRCVLNETVFTFDESTIAWYEGEKGRWFTNESKWWHVSVMLENRYRDPAELEDATAAIAPSCTWVRSDEPGGYYDFTVFSANSPALFKLFVERDAPISNLSEPFECTVADFPERGGPECTYEEYVALMS